MKVILQEAVDNLGSIGDVVNVKDGYARNFLFPRSKAVIATPAQLKQLEAQRGKIDREKERILAESKSLAEKLAGVSISRAVRVGEEGKLYGSVGVGDVSDMLAEQGYVIAKKQVLLPEPIRALGEFVVPIRLHTDVTVEIKLTVVEEKTE